MPSWLSSCPKASYVYRSVSRPDVPVSACASEPVGVIVGCFPSSVLRNQISTVCVRRAYDSAWLIFHQDLRQWSVQIQQEAGLLAVNRLRHAVAVRVVLVLGVDRSIAVRIGGHETVLRIPFVGRGQNAVHPLGDKVAAIIMGVLSYIRSARLDGEPIVVVILILSQALDGIVTAESIANHIVHIARCTTGYDVAKIVHVLANQPIEIIVVILDATPVLLLDCQVPASAVERVPVAGDHRRGGICVLDEGQPVQTVVLARLESPVG